MVGHNVKKTLLKTVATCAMVLGVGIGSANAFGIEDAWNFNLSLVNGKALTTDRAGGVAGSFSGLADRTNINNVNLDGFGVIEQQVVGGIALGQSFVENGFLNVTGSTAEPGAPVATNVALNLGDAGALYFTFDGLTGTLNGDGSITFDPGVGTIRLLLDSNAGTADPSDGDILELATFSILAPSGGATKDFFGGTDIDSVIAVTLVQTSEFGAAPLVSSLFTDQFGNGFALNDPATLHLGNFNALKFGDIDETGIDMMGNGVAKITVQNNGQYNIKTIPEASSMAAFGVGLIGLMGMARRRRKTV